MGSDPAENLGDLGKLLLASRKNRASDIHIKVGQKPLLRINTVLHEVGNRSLSEDDVNRILSESMTDVQEARLKEDRDVDFALGVAGVGRFRFNVYYERGMLSAAIRRVETEIPTFDALNIPLAVRKVCDFHQGLVVVAGPAGSGKSTTLACILNHINETRKKHIITLEDPIEYLFEDKKSFVTQREVGIDVSDYAQALKTVVRQDPDVILIGEIRDEETATAAARAAATGHLVLSTAHSADPVGTVVRLRGLGLPDDVISESLLAVLGQRLARRNCRECRTPAFVTEEQERILGPLAEGLEPQRGTGCDTCRGSGYIGRIGLFELAVVDSTLQDMIADGAAPADLREHLAASGHVSLVWDALQKIKAGDTSVEELLRVVPRRMIQAEAASLLPS